MRVVAVFDCITNGVTQKSLFQQGSLLPERVMFRGHNMLARLYLALGTPAPKDHTAAYGRGSAAACSRLNLSPSGRHSLAKALRLGPPDRCHNRSAHPMIKWIGLFFALVVLSAPLIWQIARTAEPGATATATPPATVDANTVAALGAEIEALKQDVQALRSRVDGLDSRTAIGLSAASQARAPRSQPQAAPPSRSGDTPQADGLRNSFDQIVLIGDRRNANEGLTVASPSFLRNTFGLPRPDLTQKCQPMSNPRLRALLSTEDVGPIRVRMLKPAIASLRKVFAEVQAFEPELYDRLASSGSLCVRLIRGSSSFASAHAYGLAVDINIGGALDNFADGKTQLGLILMADFFHSEGWIWGAGFGREDSMHFEVSREKIQEWRELGLL
ncbi:MAG: hypothetical protein CML60_11965 [Rhodobacteraceae bacterium]|nr:hypothetical protein [Paracoccaceae bacterium]